MNNYIGNQLLLNRSIKPIIYLYIMIIITITLSLIIFFMLCNYKTYYNIKAIVVLEEDNYYLDCYVPIDKISYFSNNELLLNRKKYRYSIINIDSNYYVSDLTSYQIIRIKLDLDKNYLYNNMVLNLKILKENKKIIEYLINIKGG